MNSPQKIKPPQSGKIIKNICAAKNFENKRLPQKKIVRGGVEQDQLCPLAHTQKETHHTEKMTPTRREKSAHIEILPPWGKSPYEFNCTITPPPPQLRLSIMTSTHYILFILRELEKNSKNLTKTRFSGSFT